MGMDWKKLADKAIECPTVINGILHGNDTQTTYAGFEDTKKDSPTFGEKIVLKFGFKCFTCDAKGLKALKEQYKGTTHGEYGFIHEINLRARNAANTVGREAYKAEHLGKPESKKQKADNFDNLMASLNEDNELSLADMVKKLKASGIKVKE